MVLLWCFSVKVILRKITLEIKKMKRLLILILSVSILQSCSDPKVESIKGGSLNNCPGKTVGQMVSGFMSSPKWSSGKSTDGQEFVNVKGGIMYQDKEVTALIQFLVNGDSFELGAVEFNGVPQISLMGLGLLNKMCEE